MVEFFYNNMMCLAMHQTPFFVNHGLHPRFDIQNVNNVMNLITEDQITWLVNIPAQLVFNLEAQKWYKKNVDTNHKD